MSKWRYEVKKVHCNSVSDHRPEYVVYSEDSKRDYLAQIYSGKELEDSVRFWQFNYSEIPTRAIYSDVLDWCVKPYTYGKKKLLTKCSIAELYPAKRIGRMFPRHKQQIIYK